MAKKAPGRPKEKAATKNLKDQNDAEINQSTDQLKEGNAPGLDGKEKVNEFEDIKDQDDGSTSNKETPEAEKAKGEKVKSELDILKEENARIKAELANKKETGKVIEVTTKTDNQGKRPIRIARHNNLHDVYVKGVLRQMTKQSYEAMAKDPKLEVSLPKSSILVEPKIQPCVDC